MNCSKVSSVHANGSRGTGSGLQETAVGSYTRGVRFSRPVPVKRGSFGAFDVHTNKLSDRVCFKINK